MIGVMFAFGVCHMGKVSADPTVAEVTGAAILGPKPTLSPTPVQKKKNKKRSTWRLP